MNTPETFSLPSTRDIDIALSSQRVLAAFMSTKAETQRIHVFDEKDQPHAIELPTSALRLLVTILAELADATGGTYFHNNNDLQEGFRLTGGAPEFRYVLGFAPPTMKNDGSFHTLKVTVKGIRGVTVTARQGYFAPRRAAVSQNRQASSHSFCGLDGVYGRTPGAQRSGDGGTGQAGARIRHGV